MGRKRRYLGTNVVNVKIRQEKNYSSTSTDTWKIYLVKPSQQSICTSLRPASENQQAGSKIVFKRNCRDFFPRLKSISYLGDTPPELCVPVFRWQVSGDALLCHTAATVHTRLHAHTPLRNHMAPGQLFTTRAGGDGRNVSSLESPNCRVCFANDQQTSFRILLCLPSRAAMERFPTIFAQRTKRG